MLKSSKKNTEDFFLGNCFRLNEACGWRSSPIMDPKTQPCPKAGPLMFLSQTNVFNYEHSKFISTALKSPKQGNLR